MPHLCLLVLVHITLVVADSDYCKITEDHTMCGDKGLGAACEGPDISRGVSERERLQILETHNRYRARIARGEETRGSPGPQPSGSNIREMVWDTELARVAQAHADQCVFSHDCADCRRVDRFGVGQNLYVYKQSIRRAETDWERAVQDWYEEVTLFNNSKVEPFVFGSDIGHYSQLVWADTDKVGCGATSYREGKWFSTLYTCNYGPNGNYVRGQMYRQGPGCSACPQDSGGCSQSYPGLCSPGQLVQSTPAMATTTQYPNIATTANNNQSSLLFSCDFTTLTDDCLIKNTGTHWHHIQGGSDNSFLEADLLYRDKTDLVFRTMISPPPGGVACLHFRYKKYSGAGYKSALTAIAWPYRGKPGKISVFRDSPGLDAWVRAQITFRKLDNYFLVMFRAGGPAFQEDMLYIALDDVKVVEGVCKEG